MYCEGVSSRLDVWRKGIWGFAQIENRRDDKEKQREVSSDVAAPKHGRQQFTLTRAIC